MKTFMIKLNTLEDVRKFVNTVTAFEGEIFSLDLLSPVEMTIHCDNCDDIVAKLKDFIVE